MRVLIVEDHELLAVGTEMLLIGQGHEVVEVVPSGEEGVTSAERHRPDLVLMDIVLEGEIDGIEAARQIRERFGIPSIFLTGLSDPETRERSVQAKPLAFLDKTSSTAEVARVVDEVAANVPNQS